MAGAEASGAGSEADHNHHPHHPVGSEAGGEASRVAGPGLKLVVKILGVAPDSELQPDPALVGLLLHEPYHVASAGDLAPHQCQTCGKVEFEKGGKGEGKGEK